MHVKRMARTECLDLVLFGLRIHSVLIFPKLVFSIDGPTPFRDALWE